VRASKAGIALTVTFHIRSAPVTADAKAAKPGPRVTRLAIVFTGLVLSLVVPSPAAAVRSEFFGIVQGQLDTRDLQGMAAARVRTERFELGWKQVEASQGSYRWAPSDQFIGALAAHRIRPFPFVWRSPPWVASNPAYPPTDSAAHEQAWQGFLQAAVARYGPGGSYWGAPYHDKYGAAATPLPIQSWQVWNEPNLRKFFDPGGTDQQSVQKYARLLRISHDAIKSQDPTAQIILAGNPGYPPSGGLKAWDFLDSLYQVPGIKNDFDAAALHPYASSADVLRQEIEKVRAVMTNHADQGTPLWLTEMGWGSDPPDRYGINQGLAGQERLLRNSFKRILTNREAWNVQRLFWFLWRDPAPGSAFAHRCSFCGSAGLLWNNRDPKPAYPTFKSFTAETTPPHATITSGPGQGGTTNDSTPTFSFASNEAGSTFECKIGASSFKSCSSPYTLQHLSDGAHNFSVKAIDTPGNVSPVASRTFTVATAAVSVSGSTLVITAAAGAKDNLAITRPSAAVLRVADSPGAAYTGSGVHAWGGCTRSSDYTANCNAAGITLVRVTSGDQIDKVDNSTTIQSSLDGGAANDLLIGGLSKDTLTGGTGADVMKGMDGNDQILARDLTSDTTINCDGGTIPGAADKAGLDLLPKDSSVSGCEALTRH
jgi:polysaccharide biosynthesis protein PslG